MDLKTVWEGYPLAILPVLVLLAFFFGKALLRGGFVGLLDFLDLNVFLCFLGPPRSSQLAFQTPFKGP
jgi:hypothetical protein